MFLVFNFIEDETHKYLLTMMNMVMNVVMNYMIMVELLLQRFFHSCCKVYLFLFVKKFADVSYTESDLDDDRRDVNSCSSLSHVSA